MNQQILSLCSLSIKNKAKQNKINKQKAKNLCLFLKISTTLEWIHGINKCSVQKSKKQIIITIIIITVIINLIVTSQIAAEQDVAGSFWY